MEIRSNIIGIVSYKVYDKEGNIIQEETGTNKIVNLGRKNILNLLANGNNVGDSLYVSKIAFGTGKEPTTDDDISITNPYIKPLVAPKIISNNELVYSWSLAQDENNGVIINEIGLESQNGDLFARKVTNIPIDKDTDKTVEGSWRIIFLQPTVYKDTVWGFAPGTRPAFVEEASNRFREVLAELRKKYNIDK